MKQVTSARGQNTMDGRERPHFVRLSAAQNVVGSLPPAPSRSGPCFVRVQRSEQTVCNASRITSRKRKGGKPLPLLKAPSKQPKTTTLQVRLEEEVRHNLDRYAEFIGANASYVVSEALKLLFKRDDEFKRWLSEHPTNINHASTQRRRSYEDRVTNMKPRSTQFGVRENTASSRQHAPRSAMRSTPINPRNRQDISQEEARPYGIIPSNIRPLSSPNNAAPIAATEGEESHGKPPSNSSRSSRACCKCLCLGSTGGHAKRSLERLPGYRLGKYWRFRRKKYWPGLNPNGEVACRLTCGLH